MKTGFKELSDDLKDLQRLYIFAEEGNMRGFSQVLDRIPDYLLDHRIGSEVYTILRLTDNEDIAEGLAHKIALFGAKMTDDPSDYSDTIIFFEKVYKRALKTHKPTPEMDISELWESFRSL